MFRQPIHVGELVTFLASVNHTGTSSMEVGIKVALLRDAAHPMLPHLGQGANQGIEDGTALAVLLQGLKPGDSIEGVLRKYEELRRPRTSMVQAEAGKNGMRYDSMYKVLAQRDREIANSATFRKSLYDYDIEKEAINLCTPA